MNVLSLFDGMSCGRIALDKLGIKVNNYFASEIDKHAIAVSSANYPDIIRLGDVTKVKSEDLPQIDLLIGGSPCQGFSFAGKQLNFDDPRSALFFEFVRLLKECKPKYFLLENVKMKKDYQNVISELLGVEPIEINSNLVSAQNRRRLYWTNIPNIEQPEDKSLFLKDILENQVDDKYLISESYLKRLVLSDDLKKSFSAIDPEKALCMTARQYANWKGTLVCEKKIIQLNQSKESYNQQPFMQNRIFSSNGIAPSLTLESSRLKCFIVPEATKKGFVEVKEGDCVDLTFLNSKTRRGRLIIDKSNCLTAANFVYSKLEKNRFRKLTPVECERLQTVPDNYTACVSDSQRYKMLGNGWTVDVIAHILKNMEL